MADPRPLSKRPGAAAARLTISLTLALLACVPHAVSAARLSTGLERRLQALGAGDSVSVLLELADQADLSGFTGERSRAGTMIQRLREQAETSQADVLAFLAARGYGGRATPFWIDNSIAVRIARSLLPELAQRADVASIEFDEPVYFEGAQSPQNGSVDWSLAMVRAPDVWKAYGLDGTGVVVGSMDTGFDPNHPALLGKWRGGSNSWRDLVNGQTTPYDDHGHGTHTIGTMVGGDGPGPFTPDIGLAYNAKFIAVKVLNNTNGFSSASIVISGAQWILDPDSNPATDDFPDVVNNSWLFFDQNFQGFHAAVTAWRAAGIVPVFCLGNNGPGTNTSAPPGNYDNTIGVGATDPGDNIASFSSRGPAPNGAGFPADHRKPDISAPGWAVLSSVPGGGYGQWFGTSMASPHVAGTIALMLQAHPGPMSLDEVRTALIGTAVDRGAPGYDDDFGYGRLDAMNAVTEAQIPSVHLAAAAAGHDVSLSWNASVRPGLIRYDLYRSPVVDDLAPLLIASTTATSYTDPHRFGRGYYHVRAVHTAAPSPLSNEVAVTGCATAPPLSYNVGASAASPVAADFDGDGLLDIAIANTTAGGSVTVALGDGAGAFGGIASFPSGARPMGMTSGDFDGDGIRDLVVANNLTAGTVSVLLGNGSGGVGDGTFAAPVAYVVHQKPVAIATGDFDQDGVLDLAVANNGFNNVSILRGGGSFGVGDGTFAAPEHYAVGSRPNAIVAGDWDGDGALDLAVVNNGNGRVSVLIGNQSGGHADGTFGGGLQYTCGASAWAIASGDFDDDGILDLAVTLAAPAGSVAILRGLGDGSFAAAVLHPAGALPEGIVTADMNGDGITDLCVANGSTDGVASVLLGTGAAGVGDGGFEAPIPCAAGTTPADLTVADFDASGTPDLAVANISSLMNLVVLDATCGPDAAIGVHVVTPNGGESWPASTEHTIAWTRDPGVVSVDVDVSRDGGATWETVAAQQTGTSVSWFVDNPSSAPGAARVRVRDDRVGAVDASDLGFTIAPDIRLGAPEPGARLALAVANPTLERLIVRFALRDRSAATLEVLDVSGRRAVAQDVGALGPGEHARDLGRGLPAGLYWVRLTQGGERVVRQAVLVR